ncbi:MAG: hypothetical protein MI723_11950, partial [Caulobacterales bacterium]|nr:hypothetical protein [Caulobacterales bacterium]
MSFVRNINIALTGFGSLVFAALLAYLVLAPGDFDRRTREFAIAKVEERVDATLGGLARSDAADRLSTLAGAFSSRLERRIEELRDGLDAGIDVFIADVLAAACALDCERREEARLAVNRFFEASIARYGVALERVQTI